MDWSDMKVLMITPSYDPIIGGTEAVVKNLAIELSRYGHEVDILTFNMDTKWHPRITSKYNVENSIKVIRWGAFGVPITRFKLINRILSTIFYFAFTKTLNIHVLPVPGIAKIARDYDVLHYHDDVDLTFIIFSLLFKKRKLLHYHTLGETFGRYRANVLCRHIIKNAVRMHVCNSRSTQDLLLSLGVPEHKTVILPNGVNTDLFFPDPKKKIGNLILFVGRFERRKGIHVLLSSLQHLNIPCRLVIIAPPSSNSKYSREILNQIKIEKKRGRHEVEWIGAKLGNELAEWYQKASVFVCPSLREAFGITNVEAMACGVPVVASNVGGIPEIVEDRRSGILVPPNNPKKLASALETLLSNGALREKMGKRGRELILKRYSWKVIAKEMSTIYEGVKRSQER
jgi:glycosyltransferase involved in cell wall biosynthesis